MPESGKNEGVPRSGNPATARPHSCFSRIRQPPSERKVVFLVCRSKVCRRNRSRIYGRERRIGHRSLLHRIHTVNSPRADTVEPAALPFTGINVEKHVQFFTHLDIELVYLVLSENVKTHATRILVMSFNYILLYFPRISRFRNTASRLKNGDYSSC